MEIPLGVFLEGMFAGSHGGNNYLIKLSFVIHKGMVCVVFITNYTNLTCLHKEEQK